MKKFVIFGDSYSTYLGKVPNGYRCYYGVKRFDGAPVVSSFEKTWWGRLMEYTGAELVLNESFSGSSVCKTGYPDYDAETSFVSRASKLFRRDFLRENNVDTALIFGGTNDAWSQSPLGELDGDDLYCVFPAFRYLIGSLKEQGMRVVVLINTEFPQELEDGIISLCETFGAEYVALKDIEKGNGHPTELGMEQIFEQMKHLF